MTTEIEQLLRDAKQHIVSLYDAINPAASYRDIFDSPQNRMADQDEIVKRIREVLSNP